MRLRGRRQARTSGAVKPPKVQKPKIQRPKNKTLRAAYKGLISGSPLQRFQALCEALRWWDSAAVYCLTIQPLDTTQLASYEKANKARALGLADGTPDGERETALLQTIRLYEKIWHAVLVKFPRILHYMQQLDSARVILEARDKALQRKYDAVLSVLNAAFQPLGLRFAAQVSESAREFDGINTIFLSRQLLKVLIAKSKTEGLLSVVFSEAVTALKAAAVERDADGRITVDVRKLLEHVIPTALSGILAACSGIPRARLFRAINPGSSLQADATAIPKQKRVQKQRVPKDPSKPSSGRGRKPGPKDPLSGYVAASSMNALFHLLADQKEHKLADVLASIPVQNPRDRICKLQRDGEFTGKWKVIVSGTTVKMQLLRH